MTDEDKTLLELAAKVYGAKHHIVHIGEWYDPSTPERLFWNPLRDDGEALRLAVKLQLGISIPPATDGRIDVVTFYGPTISIIEYPKNSDRNAATRRAIVRAAAEIGKAMP